ncbi:hypothetical protein [Spirosoma rigui]|uniref:hypothetical protein n=1 Tax=Spirosoma rigui TaxID=564064 RepID=UPI0012D2E590|nr:hypothetical protein [Spirosoma rigui]
MNEETLQNRQDYNVRLLTIFFLYVTFNGAVRKWLLTDSLTGNLLLGIQIGFPLIFAVLVRTKPYTRFTFSVLAAYSLLLVIMAFNPLGQSILHGVIGYFLHIGVFLPLLIYFNDRDAFPVERMNRLFFLVILFELLLGTLQFMSPSTSPINKYVRDTTDTGGIAMLYTINRVRITGSFSYLGGMGSLFVFFGFWIWGLRLTKASTLLVGFALICCAVISPMTGSRGLSAFLIILTGCAFISTITDLRNSLALGLLSILIVGVLQFTDLSLVSEAYTGLNERVTNHVADSENETRAFGQIWEIIDFRGNYPWLGTGLGGTYQGAIALMGESIYLKEYGYYEEEPERVILEGGYLLFMVRIFLWLLVFQQSRIPVAFCALLLILHVFYTVTVFNVFTAFYTVMAFMYLDRSYYVRQQNEI